MGLIGRIVVLLIVGELGRAAIEVADRRPIKSAADFILWIGIAAVIALRSPVEPS